MKQNKNSVYSIPEETVLFTAPLLKPHLLTTARATSAGFSIPGLATLSGYTGVFQVMSGRALTALDAVNVATLPASAP
jgi:hypothetical protein